MYLPGRAGRVTAAIPPDPELIYAAIQRARALTDRIDNGQDGYLHATLNSSSTGREDARAWAWACVLIIDVCEIDSMTLNALANSVWKGRQDALDYY